MPTLLDWLILKYPTAKRTTLKRMVAEGRVLINGQPVSPVRLKEELGAGAEVRLRAAPSATPATELRVIHEDGDLIVVDKPAGLLTSTVPREPRPTLLKLVRQHVGPRARLGLIHRLDADASGLLVFSLSDLAYRSLKTQFYKHTVDRSYTAVTEGVPRQPRGTIESRLVERADGTVHSTSVAGRGMKAITEWEVLRQDGRRALLRVTLHTGRKHQIRVHLAEMGTPVVGDAVYGKGGPRLMLAATGLAFTHPRSGRRLEFQLQPPSDFSSQ